MPRSRKPSPPAPPAKSELLLIALYRRVKELEALAEALAQDADAMADALGLPDDWILRQAAAIDGD
jgi:hypothetical protein